MLTLYARFVKERTQNLGKLCVSNKSCSIASCHSHILFDPNILVLLHSLSWYGDSYTGLDWKLYVL